MPADAVPSAAREDRNTCQEDSDDQAGQALRLPILQAGDVVGALLGLLDLLPRLHLLLLEKGDSVGKQLSVSLDTTLQENIRLAFDQSKIIRYQHNLNQCIIPQIVDSWR